MSEIYVSTDVEADGPIPGPHSMLSFASAAFVIRRPEPRFERIGAFERNLAELEGAAADPETAAWWAKPENRAAHETSRRDPVAPAAAMQAYAEWLESLERTAFAPGGRGRVVFVGYPATYDFLFVHWYLIRFTGKSPFSHAGLDIKTYAMALLRREFRETAKSSMPKRWFGKAPHTHVALDDAIEQGELFCRMLIENEGRR